MRLLPEARNGRFFAVLLLLIVVSLAYLGGVHWWFVAPHLAISEQMDDLRDQQLRFRAIVAERPELEKRLAEVRNFEQNNLAFLAQSDANAASADLLQRLKSAVSQHVPQEQTNRCQILSNQTYSGGKPELYQRVTIQVRMRCDMEQLAAILYELESGKPYLFADQLMIYKQNYGYVPPGQKKQQQSALDVRFNLTGYLRQRGAEK